MATGQRRASRQDLIDLLQQVAAKLDHGYRADCAVLVCWEHNWPDSPLEVLELRSAIETLGE